MSNKVEVSFTIMVRGMVGGSFEMDREDFERIQKRWESRLSSHRETELADELLGFAPFDYMRHLNIDEMEIEELDEATQQRNAQE